MLKKATGENLETKVIMKAVAMLPGLIGENTSLKRELAKVEQAKTDAENAINNFVKALNNFSNFKT